MMLGGVVLDPDSASSGSYLSAQRVPVTELGMAFTSYPPLIVRICRGPAAFGIDIRVGSEMMVTSLASMTLT
jgi:hypothetical protein